MPHDLQATLRKRYPNETPAINPALEHPVIAHLLNHRSVRSFLDEPLAQGVIESLVAAAQSAASSSNLQTWSVVAVQDAARRDRLATLAGNQAHIRQAPLLLVWLADVSRARRIARKAGQRIDALDYFDTFLTASVDAALAAQNAVVAAEALGLGTVYIGALRNRPEEVAEVIGAPEGTFPVVGLVVGRPAHEGFGDIKPRLPQSLVLHQERYAVPPAETSAIAAYDQALRGFQQQQKLPPTGWIEPVLNRFKDGHALNGRDRLHEAVRGAGLALR